MMTKILLNRKNSNGLLKFLLLAIASFQFSTSAKNVSLSWDPSPSDAIAGYKVFYGSAPGTYTSFVTVGNITEATVTGLTEGATYYFVVKAFNSADLESEPSNEISYTVPMPVALQMQSAQVNGTPTLAITATGDVSATWTLESSEDLKVWTVYTNGTGAIDIQVPLNEGPNKFFRLKNP